MLPEEQIESKILCMHNEFLLKNVLFKHTKRLLVFMIKMVTQK